MKKIKRGQAWGFDLIIASTLFLGGIITFYLYSLNISEEADTNLNKLTYDGNIITNILLSEGVPSNWTESNLIYPGLLSKNKINQTKLDMFYSLSVNNYDTTKAIFNTEYEYYLFFSQNITVNGVQIEGIGKAPVNPRNLIKIERITLYKDQPAKMNLDIWQ